MPSPQQPADPAGRTQPAPFSVFFDEWHQRAPGEHRDLARAQDLLGGLNLAPDTTPVPVLGVVGSKGKGTTATYASAHLAAAGLDVVTVTGPSFRSHRERVRFNGAAIDESALADITTELRAARELLPPPRHGYLTPNVLFLAAGLLHARHRGADACVLEAGMGGRGDELRLLGPRVVAMATVFAEHIGILGDTVEEIAREKAAVAGPATDGVVRLAQSIGVAETVDATVRDVTSGRVAPEVLDPATPTGTGAEPPADLLPPGLSAASARLGCRAGALLLRLLGRPPVTPAQQREVLSTLRLPARLSRHRSGDTELIVDSAINRTGVRTALEHARAQWPGTGGDPRDLHVLLCLPDHKDVDGAIDELGALPVTAAILPEDHLRFEHALPDHWDRVRAEELTRADIARMGRHVLVLGTVYFTGRVLDVVGADTERLFEV